MKITYSTPNNRITVEVEAESQREAFSELANFQEVFDNTECGKCGSDNVVFCTRTVDDNLYYELRCRDCGAKLSFGVMKKGGRLFPKRKDKDGKWLPDNGWVKWNAETQREE